MCLRRAIRTGNASRDDNDVGVLEGSFGAVISGKVASSLLQRMLANH